MWAHKKSTYLYKTRGTAWGLNSQAITSVIVVWRLSAITVGILRNCAHIARITDDRFESDHGADRKVGQSQPLLTYFPREWKGKQRCTNRTSIIACGKCLSTNWSCPSRLIVGFGSIDWDHLCSAANVISTAPRNRGPSMKWRLLICGRDNYRWLCSAL